MVGRLGRQHGTRPRHPLHCATLFPAPLPPCRCCSGPRLTFLIWQVAISEPAPSLITMLIGMFMSPGTVPEGAALYRGQAGVQLLLVVLAAISVPWMLLAKPLLLWQMLILG